MGSDPLLGSKHPGLRRLRRLSGRRSTRRDEGRFVIDGPTLLADALTAGLTVEEVFVEDIDEGGPRAVVVEQARSAGAAIHRVRPGTLGRHTDPATPQGIAAVAVIPDPVGLASLRGLVLVLDAVSDPGNVGTLVRVAEATAAGVVLGGDAVDPFGPKVVRASAGSVFRVPVVRAGATVDACRALAAAGHRLVVADAAGDLAYDRVDLTGDVAVVVGHEARGVGAEVAALAHVRAHIPMAGSVESLNVAMAGCVFAFEVTRQGRHDGAGPMSDRARTAAGRHGKGTSPSS